MRAWYFLLQWQREKTILYELPPRVETFLKILQDLFDDVDSQPHSLDSIVLDKICPFETAQLLPL